MTRAIFPDLNSLSDSRRKKLHEKFYNEIVAIQDGSIHLVVFELEGLKFAIEIGKIDEVVLTGKVSKLPKSPPYIPGISNIRGTDIIILDLALKLGLTDKSEEHELALYTIVVASQRFTVGILTNTIPTNLIIDGNNIQATGLDISGSPEDETYIKGVISLQDQKIYFIDIDELLEGDRSE